MLKMRTLLYCLSIMYFGLIPKAGATHIIGMELTYVANPGVPNSYIFTAKCIRDCGDSLNTTTPEPPNLVLCYTSSCVSNYSQVTLTKIIGNIPTTPPQMNGTPVYQNCGNSTTCNSITATVHGYRWWWYQGVVTLPSTCADWHFWISYCCRVGGTLNIGPANSQNYNFYVDALINNTTYSNNASAQFMYADSVHKVPIIQCCVNFPYVHQGGVIDPDGDSVYVETTYPKSHGSTFCASGTPYNILAPNGIPSFNINDSAGNPLQSNNTYYLDHTTGFFGFVPTQLGRWDLNHRATDYKNGQFVGYSSRDMHMIVKDCGANAIIDTDMVCFGGNYMFPDSTWYMNAQYDTAHVSIFNSYLTPCDSFYLTYLLVDSVDTGINQVGNVFTASASNALSYQWIQCTPLSVISGATSQSYTATTPGDYAVIVTNQNNCSDTSACLTFIPTFYGLTQETDWNVYPNPASDMLIIEGANHNEPVLIEIYDISGKLVLTSTHKSIPIQSLTKGVYFIKWGKGMKRIQKE